jgi:hypothetical protein
MTAFDRHQAFSIEITEGTGRLTHMVQSGDVFEVFKEDCIVQITTPEVIDPDNTNPQLPPNRKLLYSEIGASNCIIARTFLQADKLCDDLLVSNKINKKEALEILRESRDSLINAYNIAFEIAHDVMEFSNEYLSKSSSSTKCIIIPHIENLSDKAQIFSTCIKRCLQRFGDLFNLVFGQKFIGHHYHKIREFIGKEFGKDHMLYEVLHQHKDILNRLIKMRNAIEHPKKSNKLVVTNFTMNAQGALVKPSWQHLPHGKEYDIDWEMGAIVECVVGFTEVATLHILLTQTSWPHGFAINSIDEENLDWECPIHIAATPLFPPDWPKPNSTK